MEEKKVIKVSLSTFFLIVAIIAIGVMGYFIYKLNDDKTKETEQVSELSNRVALLENTKSEPTTIEKTNTEIEKNNSESIVNNTKKTYSYNEIKGVYKYSKELTADITATYELELFENGTFDYHYLTEYDQGLVGNYIIVDDEIILNKFFSTGSGVGMYATVGTLKLKINSDGSLTDTNELLDVVSQYKSLLKEINLQKSSNKDDIEAFNKTNINEMIKSTALISDYK